jgi:hypothetical protein
VLGNYVAIMKQAILILAIISFTSCSSKMEYVKSELMPTLKDSTNLADLGAYVISDFNYAKVDDERVFIVDFFGGQVLGFKNGKELFFSLSINYIPKLESNWQLGNIAYSDNGSFLSNGEKNYTARC